MKVIVSGDYTPSLAAALGVSVEDVSCGHAVPVQYMRGNVPQSGRPT